MASLTAGRAPVHFTSLVGRENELRDVLQLLEGSRLADSTREVARLAALPSRVSFGIPAALRSGEIPAPDGIDLVVRDQTVTCHTRNTAVTLRLLLDWADDLAVDTPSAFPATDHGQAGSGQGRLWLMRPLEP